jgi:phage shock protein E
MSFNALTQDRLIVDVRTLPEWEIKRIEDAQLIEWQNILVTITEMDIAKSNEILLFCRSGNRSGKAKKILEDNGYTNVKNLGSIEEAGSYLKLPILKK